MKYSIKDTFDKYLLKNGIDTIDNSLVKYQHPEDNYLPKSVEVAYQYAQSCKGLFDQLIFMDPEFNNLSDEQRDAVQNYVTYSDNIQRDSLACQPNRYIDLLDSIFEASPPLSRNLTVYRKYSTRLDVNEDCINSWNRYVSTTLSMSFCSSATFQSRDNNPMYVRIELTAGMKVLPLFDWDYWRHNSISNILSRTEFEILLPRNAKMYIVPSYALPSLDLDEEITNVNIVYRNERSRVIRHNQQPNPAINHLFIVSPNSRYTIQETSTHITTGGSIDNNTLTLHTNNGPIYIKSSYDDMQLADKLLKAVYNAAPTRQTLLPPSLPLLTNKIIKSTSNKPTPWFKTKSIYQSQRHKSKSKPRSIMQRSKSGSKSKSKSNKSMAKQRSILRTTPRQLYVPTII